MTLCECGCGEEVKPHRRYITGHNRRGKHKPLSEETKQRMCGKTPWNKGLTKETDERVKKISESLKNRKLSKEHIAKMTENHADLSGEKHPMYGKHHTKEAKEKISKAHKGKHHSPETEFKKGEHRGHKFEKGYIPWSKGLTKETDARLKVMGANISIALTGRKQPRDLVEKRALSNSKPHSKEHTKNRMKSLFTSPTNPEIDLSLFLDNLLPEEYAYSGDGEIIIAGLCPDFINIGGKKKIIEVFGEPFHDPSNTFMDKIDWKRQEWGRQAIFGQLGYDTLIVWSKELRNKELLKEKILDFHGKEEINWR